MFIRTRNWNEYINSDDIVKLYSKPSQAKGLVYVFALLRDDRVVELGGSDLDEVAARTMPIIPATPGYEALGAFEDEDAAELTFVVVRHPVLGWRVDPWGGLTPVTLDDMDDQPTTIRYPDGRVVIPADTTFENEDAWLKAMHEQEQKRRAASAVA